MRLQLRGKLIVSFLAVIAVTGIIGTAVGVYLVGTGIVREAQNKVTLDLNSAHQIYQQQLLDIRLRLEFTAMRRFAVREALRTGNRALLLEGLRESMERSGLDVLTVTDPEGRVVLRARNPEVAGDSQAQDQIVGRALAERQAVAGTQIVAREELLKESEELAERARIELIPTSRARPTSATESTSGMMLKAAIPVLGGDGELLGVLYGGVLLNRDYEIVDATKDIVYRGATYEGTDIGTATIFQGDLRISTNVMTRDGRRAIGTRVSSEVYDRVVGEGRTWTTRAFVVNDWYLTAYEPIRDVDGEVIGILYVGVLEQKYVDMKRTTFLLLAGVTVAGAVLALGIAYVLANAIVRPIQRLERGVEALAHGDFDSEVIVKTADEIGSLAESFNRVRRELKDTYAKLQGKVEAADEDLRRANKELREKQKQLVHAEKLASLGALAAGVAHEVNNPLGTIALYAQMTLDELSDGDESRRENIGIILKHSTKAGQIVKNLLEFARRTEVEAKPVEINAVLEDVLSMTGHQAELQQVEVVKQLGPDVPMIVGDADKLRQVFVNVVVNALQAMPEGGRLTVASSVATLRSSDASLRSTSASEGQAAQVRIADTGRGIPQDKIDRIFDPFFTTKETGKGTGLGLSVSHGIVEQHKGEIAVESSPAKGTTFTVTIPAAPGEQEP